MPKLLNLPGMDAPIVRAPHHARPLRGGYRRLHVSHPSGRAAGEPLPGPWEWAVLLHSVIGWKVSAYGADFTPDRPTTHRETAELLVELCAGAEGDGFDRLPRGRFCAPGNGKIAHLRRPDGQECFCGIAGAADAEFDTRQRVHVEQHCIDCDATYRAEHYGRVPLAETRPTARPAG